LSDYDTTRRNYNTRAVRAQRRQRSLNPSAQFNRLVDSIPLPRVSRQIKSWITVFGVAGIFFGCLAMSIVAGVTLRATMVSDAFNPFRDEGYGGVTATPNATPIPELAADQLVGWQGTERVTVLVMGVDTRPEERGYRTRTDTMMLMSIDPVTKRASMLSIPRDTFVDVPGYGLERINTAYPLGGAELAIETVQYNFGIRIDYYAIVEFAAFTTLVDEIGGIDIFVPVEIYDPSYPDMDYGYDPFHMPAGQQHMDGITALKYARTRHQDNDYERARRQQGVIMAIRNKIVSFDMLPTLIQKAPQLYTTMDESLRTNMTLQQMTELASLAAEVPEDSIRQGVIDANYLIPYTTEEGAQVAIPNREKIGPYLQHIFWLDSQ
jgi:polyisoprenyl-teichoic acid--peptidoglycan teichoic acid transferase